MIVLLALRGEFSGLEDLTYADSFNLLVNNGEAAGQVIYHVSSTCISKPFISTVPINRPAPSFRIIFRLLVCH